jgi:hypothetical protein
VIKQVWLRSNEMCLGDKTNVIRWYNKFDQEVMKGALVIKQMGSGDKTSLMKR